MTILTLQTLVAAGACTSQCDLFEGCFGQQVDITPELCVSVAPLFNLDWAARNLLSADAYKAYDKGPSADAYKAYCEARSAAYKAYDEARSAAYKAYDKASAAAYKAYEEARSAAHKAYREALAFAFGRAYCQ